MARAAQLANCVANLAKFATFEHIRTGIEKFATYPGKKRDKTREVAN